MSMPHDWKHRDPRSVPTRFRWPYALNILLGLLMLLLVMLDW